ncbi:MMPL family transporter [Leuconostoc pseudomesenteroides]|uniref:MMPL family transporter n=1 Tax=Leuconostoc pseudomesenteroides TaxID=33968 RepID=UPI00403DED4A
MKGSKKSFIIQAAIWLVIMVSAIMLLPNTSQLIKDKGDTSLPSTVKSEVAQKIQDNWGKGQDNTRQVIVVFNNGDKKITTNQAKNIAKTVANFKNNKSTYHIKSILAPEDGSEARAQLVSKDKTTELVQLTVGKQQSVSQMTKTITQQAQTDGVKTYVTGSDILEDDFSEEIEKGLQKTEWITVIFIFLVLMIVFRSVITPLVSLLSVGVSFITALSVVMNLVDKFNFPLSNFTQVFMVVVLFGIGTDYNILLFDQFKAELQAGYDKLEATKRALKTAGRTILFSGISVLIGFATLALAKFSIYQSAVGVSIAVAVLLLVLLTLNPFFMAVFGKYLFWPSKKFSESTDSKLWHGIAKKSIQYPLLALLAVVIMAIPLFATYNTQLNYDTLTELGDNVAAKKGFKVVQKHFSEGTAEPSTLYIKSNNRLDNADSLQTIDGLVEKLKKTNGVKTVTSATQPGGSKIKELYVRNQLGTVTDGLQSAIDGSKSLGTSLQEASTQLANSDVNEGVDGAKQLVDGSNTLKNGSAQLYQGTSDLNDGIGMMSAGTSDLAEGLSALNSHQSDIQSGVTTLNTSVSQLHNGSAQITSGLQQLESAITSQAGGSKVAQQKQIADLKSSLQSVNAAMASLLKQTGNQESMSDISETSSLLAQSSDNIKKDADELSSLLSSDSVGSDPITVLSDSDINTIINTVNAQSALSETQQAALKSTLQNQSKSINAQISSAQNANAKKIATASSVAKKMADDTTSFQKVGDTLTSELSRLNSLEEQRNNWGKLASNAIQANEASMSALDQLNDAIDGTQKILTALQGNKSQPGLVNGSQQLTNGLSQLQAGVSNMHTSLQSYTTGVSSAASGAVTVNDSMSDLKVGSQSLTDNQSQLTAGINDLSNGQLAMYQSLAATAGQVQVLQSGLHEGSQGATQIGNGLSSANDYLIGLKNSSAAKTYYVPKNILNGKEYQSALYAYMSENKKSTSLNIVLDSNPSSEKAMKKVSQLQTQVENALKGTGLSDAVAAIGGQTAKTNDTRSIASADFIRTGIIMVVGIMIALIFITRSLLQPLYIMATLLVSYVMALSLTQIVSHFFLKEDMLSWTTPFFAFIMLLALGVDYSIFLMMKYRDLQQSVPSARDRILKATGIIGVVVLSAALILGGTFAALIPSGVLTLIQVAITVIFGLIILVIVLPMVIPSMISLTYPIKSMKRH